jgi:hypothetical protein
MTTTVDYSYTYVGADQIAGDGHLGTERYLGTDGRCITVWERDELLAEGLGIGLIWESAADRSLDGYWAGVDDAGEANYQADRLGAPGWVPIRYATDFHASHDQIWGPIREYHRGIVDAGGRPPGVYGGAPVIDMAWSEFGMRFGWQAAAASWSNYQLSPNAVLLQEVEQIWGGAADVNTVLVPDDRIDWLWGYSPGDDMTEEDFARIQKMIDDSFAREVYRHVTGGRIVNLDGRLCEPVIRGDGSRALRYIGSPEEIKALKAIDEAAEAGECVVAQMPADVAAAVRRWPVV